MLSCLTSINVLLYQYNVGKKSKKTINRSQTGQHLTSINVLLDQYNVGKKSKKTINRSQTGQHLTSINSYFDQWQVKKITPKNDLFLYCRRKTKQLSKKELSNVAPASLLCVQ
jgi:hypothetical protein